MTGRDAELAAIGRALSGGGKFSGVVIAGAAGVGKTRLAREVLAPIANVEVTGSSSLLMDFVRSQGARMIIRGLRAVSDFDYEFQMVGMNRALDDSVETVFLMADARRQAIASTLVKAIARLGGDVSRFVTPEVQKALVARYGSK